MRLAVAVAAAQRDQEHSRILVIVLRIPSTALLFICSEQDWCQQHPH
jgi:hypothetical protein